MYCPECKSKLIENVVREYCSPYSDHVKEEYGLWCDGCGEDKTSHLMDIQTENQINATMLERSNNENRKNN